MIYDKIPEDVATKMKVDPIMAHTKACGKSKAKKNRCKCSCSVPTVKLEDRVKVIQDRRTFLSQNKWDYPIRYEEKKLYKHALWCARESDHIQCIWNAHPGSNLYDREQVARYVLLSYALEVKSRKMQTF